MHQRVGAARPGCKRHTKEKECSRPATQTRFSPGCLATNCLSWPTGLATFQHCDTPHTSLIIPQYHEEDPRHAIFYLSKHFSCFRFAHNSEKTTPSRLEESRCSYYFLLHLRSCSCHVGVTKSLGTSAEGRYIRIDEMEM